MRSVRRRRTIATGKELTMASGSTTGKLVLTAIEFIGRQLSKTSAGVTLTSDEVTYPQGLESTDAPYQQVGLTSIFFYNPVVGASEQVMTLVQLWASAHFAGLAPGADDEEVLEIANCKIELVEPAYNTDFRPTLAIHAEAQPTPVQDSRGLPGIEWEMSIKGEHSGVSGHMDVTFRVVIGADGTVELQGSPTDRSNPDVTCGVYPGYGVAVEARWPFIYAGAFE
jgi:hypothetical protein